MLVLSRRADEEIIVDGRIRIKVLATKGGKVRLGITAPDNVRIERGELAGTRTIECLQPPRRDGLLFDVRSSHAKPRCADRVTLTTDDCEFPPLPA